MADQYWSNVVLALPMDGVNGATTFTDISPTPKAVTRYGNAQISTARLEPWPKTSREVGSPVVGCLVCRYSRMVVK